MKMMLQSTCMAHTEALIDFPFPTYLLSLFVKRAHGVFVLLYFISCPPVLQSPLSITYFTYLKYFRVGKTFCPVVAK